MFSSHLAICFEDFLRSLIISSSDLSMNCWANSTSRTGGSGSLGSFQDFFVQDRTFFGLLSGSLKSVVHCTELYSLVLVYFDEDQFLSLNHSNSLLSLHMAFLSSTFITSCTIANFIKYWILSRSRVFQVVLNFFRLLWIFTFEKSFLSYQSKCKAFKRGIKALKSLMSSRSCFDCC